MTGAGQIVIFTLDGQRFGIPLGVVVRVVRAVEIIPLPAGPAFILGVINVQGKILPVLDLRRRFGLPERRVELSDQLIIICCANRSFALMTETACEVQNCTEHMLTEATEILPELRYLAGVAKLPDGLIMIQNLETLIASAETDIFKEFMQRVRP